MINNFCENRTCYFQFKTTTFRIACRKLDKLIDKMVENQGVQVIFDMEILSFAEDEASQEHYHDNSLMLDIFTTSRNHVGVAWEETKA